MCAQYVSLDPDLLISLKSMMSSVARRSDVTQAEHESVELASLRMKAILGAGGYGAVMLVQQVETERTFALKKMGKEHVMKKRQVRVFISRGALAHVTAMRHVEIRLTQACMGSMHTHTI